jgi:hypothetical protein
MPFQIWTYKFYIALQFTKNGLTLVAICHTCGSKIVSKRIRVEREVETLKARVWALVFRDVVRRRFAGWSPTFRDSIPVPTSRVEQSKQVGSMWDRKLC